MLDKLIDCLKIIIGYEVQSTKDHKSTHISMMPRESPMPDDGLTTILMMA